MNIQCQSCNAKYSVPDDKVKGRKVKIGCKKCGSHIVVDGTSIGVARGRQKTIMGGVAVAMAPQQPVVSAPTWTVAVSEEKHEEMTVAVLVAAYSRGTIDADTFIWREGMDDWLTPFEIPEIAAALESHGFVEPPPAPEPGKDTEAALPSMAPPGDAFGEPVQRKAAGAARREASNDMFPMSVPDEFPEPSLAAAFPEGADPEPSDPFGVPAARTARTIVESDLGLDLAQDAGAGDSFSLDLGASLSPVASLSPTPSLSPAPNPIARPATQATAAKAATKQPSIAQPAAKQQSAATKQSSAAQSSAAQASTPLTLSMGPPDNTATAQRSRQPSLVPDLFAGAAAAGSEEELINEPAPARHPASSLTGARNENSVLFSLDALVSGGKAEGPGDNVNMDDLLALPPAIDDAPSSIQNLTASAFVAPATGPLIQPVAVAPAVAVPAPAVAAAAKPVPVRKGGGVSVLGAGLAVVLLGGLGYLGWNIYSTGELLPPPLAALVGLPSTDVNVAAAPKAVEEPVNPSPSAPAPPVATSALPAATGGQPAAAALPTQPVPSSPAPVAATPTTAALAAAPAAATTRTPTPAPAAAPAPTPAAPVAAVEPAAPAPIAEPLPESEGDASAPPFNVEEAKSALSAAAAASAASCKRPEGPTGEGPVQVTFKPSGRVTSAVVGGDFKGTVVGGCIARIFRSARVSQFSGGARTVSKTVHIQ